MTLSAFAKATAGGSAIFFNFLMTHMVRRAKSGKLIISASEVAGFTVCPESWRLKVMDKVKSKHHYTIDLGQELHDKWASDYDESILLFQYMRITIELLVLALAVFLLLGDTSTFLLS